MKAWKVTDSKMRSSFMSRLPARSRFNIKYKIGAKIIPLVKGSCLFAFDNLEDAKRFAECDVCSKRIFECDMVQSRKERRFYFNNLVSIMRYYKLYWNDLHRLKLPYITDVLIVGTVLADEIT